MYVLSRNKKNNVYPCKPQFLCIKVGFKGVKIILACFSDVTVPSRFLCCSYLCVSRFVLSVFPGLFF